MLKLVAGVALALLVPLAAHGSEHLVSTPGQTIVKDDFDGKTLWTGWRASANPGVTVAKTGEQVVISGVPVYDGSPYPGGSIELVNRLPAHDFRVSADVRTTSGSPGGATYVGTHFGLVVGGSNGNYVWIQYWAGSYRIAWNNENRVYTEAFGDEVDAYHTWKIVYDATAKAVSAYVDERQIGPTITHDLGDTFAVAASVGAPVGVPVDMRIDDLVVKYKP